MSGKNYDVIVKKIFITAVLYGIFRGGFNILLLPAKGLSPELAILGMPWGEMDFSIFYLSFTPAIVGYFMVELLFLIIPALRRLRNNGFKGRKLINQWALWASFSVAFLQAWTPASILGLGSAEYGESTILLKLMYSTFFVAGFAIVLFIGRLISRYGIGNGFCIIIGMLTLEEAWKNLAYYINYMNINNMKINYIGFILFGVSCFLIVHLIRKKAWQIEVQDEKTKKISVAFFLQGVLALTLGENIMGLRETLDYFSVGIIKIPQLGTWTHALLVSFTVIPASLLGYYIFSGRRRIASNLSLDKASIQLDIKPLLISMALLCLMALAFTMPFPFWDQMFIPHIASLVTIITFILICYDLWEQWKLEVKGNSVVEVCELDNVYLASVLKDKLDESNIMHTIQGYRYRSFYFFFDPLVKMKLLVSLKDRERAGGILKSLAVKNV